MKITILTPTYNRARLLPRLYESLCRQTFRDFEWLIVDDGSSDNTAEVVGSWHADFPIRYHGKPNGGKHTAINLGATMAEGELVFIADSDDLLPETALQTVAEEWAKAGGRKNMAGVAGLDVNIKTGKIVGSGLPHESIDCNAMDIRYVHRVCGDMKEVFRADVLCQFPFPEIPGERFCPEQLVWFRIAQQYKLHYFNKPIYLADYQEDGITAGIVRARMNSPVAACTTYGEMLEYPIPYKQKIKAAINYWRFRCCITSAGLPVPHVKASWWIFRPLGYLMHLKDRQMTTKRR